MNLATEKPPRTMPPSAWRSPDCSPDDMRSLVKSSLCSMDYQAVTSKTPAISRLRGIELGGIDVIRHDGIGQRVVSRSPAHIRQHWVDDFVISMPMNAQVTTRQGGRVAHVDEDGFVILSTMRPFDAVFKSRDATPAASAFLVRISGSLLRARLPTLDRYCGLPLRVNSGAGRIMRGMFELALEEGAALGDTAQIQRFGGMLLDAITNVVADMSADPDALPPAKSTYESIREQAIGFIHAQLSNPDLDVRHIARHCGISVRQLQAAFAADAIPVVTYIREARLQQCRQSLRHPELRHISVIDIAMRWGFNDAPYFSRAYKARFGKTPSADRSR